MVQSTGAFSGGGVVVMGAIRVTTLHPRGLRSPELPPLPEAMPPSSKDSSWMVWTEGDPLFIIPTNTVPESFPSGERLRLLRRWAVNSRFPNQMVSPGASPTSVKLLPLATNVSFSEQTFKTFRGKHATNTPSWHANYRCFMHQQITGWSRSRVSSSKVVS
jgi:hypothetical protein